MIEESVKSSFSQPNDLMTMMAILSAVSRTPATARAVCRIALWQRNCALSLAREGRPQVPVISGPKLAISSLPSPRYLSSSVPATTVSPDADRTPTTLIDLSVSAKIEGEESQIAIVQLRPGESLRAESASMIFMTEGVEMNTTLGGSASGGSGALSGAMKRMLTGQNIFLTDFSYQGTETGTVALGTDFPSKILRLSLDDMHDTTLICQRGAYLASNPNVEIDMEFTKTMTAGFFGGQGFILQKLSSGSGGDVLVKGGGTIVVHYLSPGQVLRVTSGSLVAFESSVQYDVQMMPGIKNAMFGGEGLFITTLTGPGRIWLQGMPPDRMIAEIARRVPSGGGFGFGVPIGGGGGTGGVGDEAAVSAQDAVEAGDASVEAERASSIATSSSVDSNSPSALFGDAFPQDDVGKEGEPLLDSASTNTSTTSTEPTFLEDDFSTSSISAAETTFDDREFSASGTGDFSDGNLFNDTTATEFEDPTASEFKDPTTTEGLGYADAPAGDESSTGLLQSIWDFFTGDD